MSTKAMPQSPGIVLNSFLKASSPPAEAPTPTTGNASVVGALRRVFRLLTSVARARGFARTDVGLRRFVLRKTIDCP